MTVPPIVPGPPEPPQGWGQQAPVPVQYVAPAKKTMSGVKLTVIILACVILPVLLCCGACSFLGVLGSGKGGGGAPSGQPGIKDVKLSSCSNDGIAFQAGIRVTNSTARQASYTVTVAFTASDGSRLASGSTLVSDVDAGQTAVDQVVVIATSREAPAKCQVTGVLRL